MALTHPQEVPLGFFRNNSARFSETVISFFEGSAMCPFSSLCTAQTYVNIFPESSRPACIFSKNNEIRAFLIGNSEA